MEQEEKIREVLKEVFDPELGVNIIDLGLVYEIKCSSDQVSIQMTLTTPGCPMHDTIVGGVKRALNHHLGIEHPEVDVVWDPPWTPEHMSSEAKEILGFC